MYTHTCHMCTCSYVHMLTKPACLDGLTKPGCIAMLTKPAWLAQLYSPQLQHPPAADVPIA